MNRVFAAGALLALLSMNFAGCATGSGAQNDSHSRASSSSEPSWGQDAPGAKLQGVVIPVECEGVDKAWAYDGKYILSQPSQSAYQMAGSEAEIDTVLVVDPLRIDKKLGFDEFEAVAEADMEYLQVPIDFASSHVDESVQEICDILNDRETFGTTAIVSQDGTLAAMAFSIWLNAEEISSEQDAEESAQGMGVSMRQARFAKGYLQRQTPAWGEEWPGASLKGPALPVRCTGVSNALAFDGKYFVTQPKEVSFNLARSLGDVATYVQLAPLKKLGSLDFDEFEAASSAGIEYLQIPVDIDAPLSDEDITDLRAVLNDSERGITVAASQNGSVSGTCLYIWLVMDAGYGRAEAKKAGLALGLSKAQEQFANSYIARNR